MVTENELKLADREDIPSGDKLARRRSYEVSIAGADLMFRAVAFSDPVPTGRQVIQALCRRRPGQIHCTSMAR